MHVHTYVHIEVCMCVQNNTAQQQLVKVVNVYMYKQARVLTNFFYTLINPRLWYEN